MNNSILSFYIVFPMLHIFQTKQIVEEELSMEELQLTHLGKMIQFPSPQIVFTNNIMDLGIDHQWLPTQLCVQLIRSFTKDESDYHHPNQMIHFYFFKSRTIRYLPGREATVITKVAFPG